MYSFVKANAFQTRVRRLKKRIFKLNQPKGIRLDVVSFIFSYLVWRCLKSSLRRTFARNKQHIQPPAMNSS